MHAYSTLRVSLLVLLAASCAGITGEDTGDKNAPQLLVTSPERGTTSSAETIVVEGIATDQESGVASLSVAGVEIPFDESGAFRAELALEPGLNFLKIVAVDQRGNTSTSTRAVLSGLFAPADEAVKDAAQIYIGHETLAALADTSEAVLAGLDIDGLLAEANPVVTEGTSSCLNATVDLQDISYSDLQVTLEPVDGGIRAIVQIVGLQAGARAFHTVACLDGSTALDVAANEIEVEAELAISVSGDELVAHLERAEARFDDLTIDVGILPSSVIEFVVGDFDRKLGEKLSDLMAEALPPIVEAQIGRLSKDHQVAIMGTSLQVSVKPSAVDFSEAGGRIFLTTKVTGATDGRPYLSNPMPLPSISQDQGVSVAVADDAINQALSALWDTGAMDRRIELTSESGADIGGGIFDHILMHAPLPPVIGTDSEGGLRLVVGDMLVDLEKSGDAISRIALSLEMDIRVEEVGGVLKISTSGEPVIYMEKLDEGFLNDRDLEILVAFASNMLSGDLNKLLGEIPMPVFAGTTVAGATVSAKDGYLQVGADLLR